MGIRYKLILTMTFIAILALTPASMLFYNLMRSVMYEDVIKNKGEEVNKLAIIVADNMEASEFVPIINYIKAVQRGDREKGDNSLRGITLLNSHGRIVADTMTDRIGNVFEGKDADQGNLIIKETDVTAAVRKTYLGKMRVKYDNDIIVAVIDKKIDVVAKQIKEYTLYSLLFGLLFVLIFSETISRPLVRLAKACKEVAAGDLTVKVNPRGRDEIARVTKEFNQMVVKRKEVEELKDDFVNNVSHELRSPIASVLSYVERLLSEQDGEINVTQVNHLNLIRKASERLSGFINNILDLAKIKSGKFDLDFKKSNMFDMAQDVVNMNKMVCIEKKVECVLSGSRERVELECDEDHVKRIIINLVGNAIKFTSENGKIEIKVWPVDNKIRCEVKNSGKGIKTENINKLFNRFEQSDSLEHHKERRRGTGLGLAISKDIVEMHKGQIFAQSEYGVSTSFIFLLPKTQKGA
ncbi:MAG: HAMP domain-containing sensor histidine kinase [Elusimicrobiota bacterium]